VSARPLSFSPASLPFASGRSRSYRNNPYKAYPPSHNLTVASYYFRFYLARAIDHAGMGDEYLKLLGPWKEMLRLGLTTWVETPEPTRSDAHA
jgi:hypothetical protein